MRNRLFLFISPALLLAPSCSIASGGVDFPFTNNETLPTFYRNGDLYGLEDLELPYEDTIRTIDVDQISVKFSRNEPVFLFLYQSSCSHCIQIHTRFNQFLFDSDTECFAFSEGILSSQINALFASYPETKKVIQKSTPNCYYLLPDGTAIDTEIREYIDLASNFENHVKPMMNLSLVYTFEKYEPFDKYLASTKSLVYFYEDAEGDAAFYNTFIKEFEAEKIGKPVAKVNLNHFSDADRQKLAEKFGENVANRVYYSEKTKEIGEGQSLVEASSEEGLLTKYYSKVIMV